MSFVKRSRILVVAICSLMLLACNDENSQQHMLHQAVAIESSDECHLCGMLITNFPGPKGELFRNGVTKAQGNVVKKFCSTRDLFSFYLDPEHTRNVTSILVHDMSKAPWDAPNDGYFINAREAWFVINSEKKGAMGKTLASFSKKVDAKAFAKEFGGQVLNFDAVDLSVL